MLNKDEIIVLFLHHCVCVLYLATYKYCYEILKICEQFKVVDNNSSKKIHSIFINEERSSSQHCRST